MVSNQKRMRYVSDDASSSDEDSYEDFDYQSKKEYPNFQNDMFEQMSQRTRRKPRCMSKNALIARENRLKKKLYINKLEKEVTNLKNDNKNLTSVINKQSNLVMELKREIKYLKSVIANSGDIKNLIRNIHNTTGMSVSSSLDKNLSLKTVYVPKIPLADEKNENIEEFPNLDNILGDDINLNMGWCGNIPDFPLTTPDSVSLKVVSPSNLEAEHNYTSQADIDDVGVCLHVSKHRVSLEFCSNCSEKAEESWDHL
ncbi:uncharacterized protein LOC130893761 isoform X1 [Diorhabda carinulata]|uniref:uncharacterized protein LOC130893761 isoform X1 n=1 Tax=Diorhabda carinulata TaxID=1163345 RepID=UPI0025A2E837|nr:uncharacterized protein LOC130893761 isoform X1 [Diorhabda carinulata]